MLYESNGLLGNPPLRIIVPLKKNYTIYASSEDQFGNYISLVRTIVATDPSVATPVSAAEQIKTIQAEKDAYAGQ